VDDFELARSVTFGQYVPGQSIIHRLDPRTKLIGALLLSVTLLIITDWTGMSLAKVALLGLTCLAGVPVCYVLKAFRSVWPFMLLLAALQIFFFIGPAYGGCTVLWQWAFLCVTTCGVHLALVSMLRFIALFLLVNLLTLTTSLNEIIHGVERLLQPLARLDLPAHELALTLAIALRFVPLLAEETERLMKAQAARGADFGRGRWGFIQRTKRLLPLLTPLFVRSLDRAEMLATAMEARCYNGSKGRTQWIQLHSKSLDYAALAAAALLCVVVITI